MYKVINIFLLMVVLIFSVCAPYETINGYTHTPEKINNQEKDDLKIGKNLFIDTTTEDVDYKDDEGIQDSLDNEKLVDTGSDISALSLSVDGTLFPPAKGNSPTISQSNDSSNTTVASTATDQSATIDQTGATANQAGNSNIASIVQTGISNIVESILQTSSNEFTVDQAGNNNTVVSIVQTGNSNVATIAQPGNFNSINVNQAGTSNFALLTQSGNSNSLMVNQH